MKEDFLGKLTWVENIYLALRNKYLYEICFSWYCGVTNDLSLSAKGRGPQSAQRQDL